MPRRPEDASPGANSPERTPSPPAKRKDVKRTPKAMMRASPTKQVRSFVALRSEIQKKDARHRGDGEEDEEEGKEHEKEEGKEKDASIAGPDQTTAGLAVTTATETCRQREPRSDRKGGNVTTFDGVSIDCFTAEELSSKIDTYLVSTGLSSWEAPKEAGRLSAPTGEAPDSPAPPPSASAIPQVYSSACSPQEVELVRAHLRRVRKRDVNVVSVNVIGDGNCFPRALLVAASPDDVVMALDKDRRQTEAVQDLRELAAKYVEKNQQFAADAFAAENGLAGSLEEGDAGTPMRSRDDLARSLRKDGTYTGQLGIEAFAQAKNWSVSVYQFNAGQGSIAASVTATTLGPKPEKADRLVAVGYKPDDQAGGHYWAYAVTEAQADETLVGELTTEAKMATAPAAGERVESESITQAALDDVGAKADEADGRGESGAVDGSAAEIVQGRAQGMTTTYVARGGEDTSGVARATGETPRETARKTKQNEKKMKMCALCKSAQGRHYISNWFCGRTFHKIFGQVLHRLPRIKKDQIGTIDPNLVICEGDMVCRSCVSFSTFVVRDRSDCAYENREEDARKVVILATHVLEKCGGQLPRENDSAELAGWAHEDAGVAQVKVGLWWHNFSSANKGERKKRVAESARDEATKKALRDLAQCPMRDRENAWRDVEGDSRRVRIFAKYVREELDGQLPRHGDVAKLAGWEHEDADLAQVPVGLWWYNFSIKNDGARKKRVEESAPDEETHQALRDLAQCKVRDKENARYDVEGDSRRVRIFATYVREECHGQLPRDKDVAALAGWAHEDAGVAQVQVAKWWHNFSSANKGERKKRVEESAPDEATQEALQYLAQCKVRYNSNCDVEGDSRRVRIFAKYVLEEFDGQLPRHTDVAELAGWEHEDADLAQVQVGLWWYNFSIKNDGARKKRVEESARDEETQKALRDLAQCKVRDKENARCDVKGDSRRVRIFATYVREELDGQLPRDEDVAELAGWALEDAVVAQVQVGRWWRDFSSRNGGERKKRVEESARDEATQQALQYLAQCEKRDEENARRDVEGDSRRVRIFATYVREELDGQLPRQGDVAKLAGWEREGAGVARVQIGKWWYNFSIMNDGGARKKRVEESARDEETQKALRDLAQCKVRDRKGFKRRRN